MSAPPPPPVATPKQTKLFTPLPAKPPKELELEYLQKTLPFGSQIEKVVSVKLVEQQGVVARVFKLDLQYKSQETGTTTSSEVQEKLPTSICVKMHSLKRVVGKKEAYEREIETFKSVPVVLASGIQALFPKLYHVEVSAAVGTYILFLEWLDAAQGSFFKNDIPITSLETARAVLQPMSEFHKSFLSTTSVQLKEKFPKLESSIELILKTFFPTVQAFSGEPEEQFEVLRKQLISKFSVAIADMLDGMKIQVLLEKLQQLNQKVDLVKEFDRSIRYIFNEAPAFSIIHGDFKLDNIFLFSNSTASEKIKVIDWQVTSIGNPLSDVTNFICQSLDKSLAMQHHEDLLGIYRSFLPVELVTKSFYHCLWFQLFYVSLYASSPIFTSAQLNPIVKKEIGSLYDLILRGAEVTLDLLLLRAGKQEMNTL